MMDVRRPFLLFLFSFLLVTFLRITSIIAEEPFFPFDDPSSGLKGYVNPEGAVVIAPQFDKAQEFREGLAWVQRPNEKYGFINRSGKFVYGPESLYVERAGFSEGLAIIGSWAGNTRKTNLGYINKQGEFVIAPELGPTYGFSEGLAAVEVGPNATGFIDKAGKIVIESKFDEAHNFSDSLAMVCTQPKVDFNLFITRFFADTSHFKGPCGFINKAGELVIPTIYSSATDFKNGRAFVTLPPEEERKHGYHIRHSPGKNHQRGLLDKTGRFIPIK